jgi:hypothetical protein
VIIDSQNALIPTIAHLPVFAEGEVLDGKLVLIDASDVEYPVALNIFDVGLRRLDSYSMLDRERLLNTAAEVMQFILASLLGAEMTSRQSTLFGYALQAMQGIPNATIHTFRELMEPNGRKKFATELAKLVPASFSRHSLTPRSLHRRSSKSSRGFLLSVKIARSTGCFPTRSPSLTFSRKSMRVR